ncbi:MAG: TIGR02147 family protein [Bdellovibrionaceae bacterium]|nr:TIGR02147 family protein [Pseudobdellovibrionaceae bacterium]
MRKLKSQINLYSYKDYRDFLADKINERKQLKLNASYRWLSSRAGFTSPNFLHLVITKKRHLSGDSIDRVAELFDLTKEQIKYFRSLVHFNKAKTPSEKEHYAAEILSSGSFNKAYPLSRDQFEYYAQWYHIPIREMLTLKNSERTAQDIANAMVPGVSKMEVEQALSVLQRMGLLQKSGDTYKASEQSVETGENFSNYGVVAYHKKMIQLGAEALDRFPSNEREISSVTIGLSEKNFQKAKEMIVEFRSKLMAISDEDQNRDQIYQYNFQVFPLSRRKGSK